jgi:glycosyltransferase involved in cell wall biosynthesis
MVRLSQYLFPLPELLNILAKAITIILIPVNFILNMPHSDYPPVSIITAVYNGKFSLFERAMNSIQEQDYPNFNIIISDDGSNMTLSQKLLKYAAAHEKKTTYIRHKNEGQAHAMNKGVALSDAAYIGFIDFDDEYKTNHISECVKYMSEDCDLISSTTENIALRKKDLLVPDKDDDSNFVHIDDCIVFGSLFGKREVFANIKFREVLSPDGDFYERASAVYKSQRLNLRTYKYHLFTRGGKMYNERKARNKKA